MAGGVEQAEVVGDFAHAETYLPCIGFFVAFGEAEF